MVIILLISGCSASISKTVTKSTASLSSNSEEEQQWFQDLVDEFQADNNYESIDGDFLRFIIKCLPSNQFVSELTNYKTSPAVREEWQKYVGSLKLYS